MLGLDPFLQAPNRRLPLLFKFQSSKFGITHSHAMLETEPLSLMLSLFFITSKTALRCGWLVGWLEPGNWESYALLVPY